MKGFRFRGFVSMLLCFSFVVVVATGLVLWLAHSPQTFGIAKGVWKHTHIFVSLLMLISGAIHLWLNWSVFWSYLWDGAVRRLNQKWELAAAVAIVAVAVGSAALDNHGGPPSLGKMSASQVAAMAQQTTESFVASLKKEGIAVHDPADSLLEIAEHNNMPREKLLALIERRLPGRMQGPHSR